MEFHYPLATMEASGRDAGLVVEAVPGLDHPRKQQMLRITLPPPPHRDGAAPA